jgi:ribosomal protein L25 (general stress protein Ctc)
MSEHKKFVIQGTLREKTGKSHTRKIRAAGKVPAVLNHEGKSQVLELDPKYLSKAWKEGGKQFDLEFNGQTKTVKITELQINAVLRTPLHVDLTYA